MSKFITTTEVSQQIESLIKDSYFFVILIAPYIHIHKRLKKIISQKLSESNILFMVVCKKNELRDDELRWFESLSRIQMVHCDNLHAKCYLNEDRAILTSMNLYEYSAVNNIEFGFTVDRANDADNYKAIFKESVSMIANIDKRIISSMAGNSRPIEFMSPESIKYILGMKI